MKNQAAFLIDKQRLEIMDCEMPSVSDTDVLVEVAHVGICGSDMHIFEDPYYAVKDIKLPVVLGHECAGRVVEVGKKVEGIVPGDRVALEPGVPCQTCEFCMSGRYNLCPDVRFLGARPWLNGAFSRYVSHPARWTFKLPDAMDTVEGALLEPLVVGMHSVNRANPGTGQAVLILGAGCIGLMTLEACLARGITNVTISDLYENRLNMAGTIGARHTVNSSKEDIVTRTAQITGNKGYDVVFETAGSQRTAALTADLVKRGGKIVMVGNVFGETPFNFFKTNSKEADILGVFRYRNLYPAAIELCGEGQAEPKKIVTNYFEFETMQAAMEYAITKKQEAVKTVIRM
ncbi:NAD(P)-dependent alcohol dehydrogenase [Clostridium sp. 1001271B_150615_H5]|uniref:NAD(P)-dependent alcohol dehydrogenase n=1 Tax=Clostridium sp. 1001271B_150615_H5 TaxID=2787105 RepID=UPI0011058417|nr:NAD(P)-dependent alcohol dehydrogenase [Clostridium sp. 1001271B_150615_H5]